MADPNQVSILGQLLRGAEKLPGNALGGPVDLANTVVNLLKAGTGYIGRESGLIKNADDLPEISDRPVGGSKWINSFFGLGESSGPVDELTQQVGGMISPARNVSAAIKTGALLKAVGATIVPAAVIKDASTVSTAQRFLNRGASQEAVFRASGIFPGIEEGAPLKAVLPDTNARLESVGGVLRSSNPNPFNRPGVGTQLTSTETKLPQGYEGYLPDVLSHPELYEALPALRDIKVRAGTGSGGSYNRETKTITAGPTFGSTGSNFSNSSSDEGMISLLLHETQHAIQDISGFMGGGNPGMFIQNPAAIQKAINAADLAGDTRTVTRLGELKDAAHSNYLNIGGELEASIVQYQRAKGDYSTNPRTLAAKVAGGEQNIIDPKKLPAPVDADESIQSILQSYQ